MRYAILADIHGNLDALQVVLEDCKQQKCTHYVCLGDVVEDLASDVGVVDLPPSEHDGHLDLVSLLQELLDVAGLGVEVGPTDLGPVLHLLEHHGGLVATGLPLTLGGLVLELPVIHDPDDGGCGLVRHLDEVEVQLTSQGQRLRQRLDPDLGPVRSDHANFARSDPFIHPGLVHRRCYC